jgi:hypothetical protein
MVLSLVTSLKLLLLKLKEKLLDTEMFVLLLTLLLGRRELAKK